MIVFNRNSYLSTLLHDVPAAHASIYGSSKYPDLYGDVFFYSVPDGTLVLTQVMGLPYSEDTSKPQIYGCHIHDSLISNQTESDSLFLIGHCPYPLYTSDLPPLSGNQGYSWNSYYTDRFEVSEIMGHIITIQYSPGSFTACPGSEIIASGTIGELT